MMPKFSVKKWFVLMCGYLIFETWQKEIPLWYRSVKKCKKVLYVDMIV